MEKGSVESCEQRGEPWKTAWRAMFGLDTFVNGRWQQEHGSMDFTTGRPCCPRMGFFFKVIKPWRLVTDLLRQLENEWDTRTAEGTPRALPTKACTKNRAPGKAAGSTDAALGVKGRSAGRAAIHTAKLHGAAKLPRTGTFRHRSTPQPSQAAAELC